MKLKKSGIAGVIFLVFVLYSLSPNFFERKLFFNELLSMIGAVVLVGYTYRSGYLLIPNSHIFKLVCLLIAWGILHLFLSLLIKTNFYFYFRNSVIVYSIFSFFIGFFLFKYFQGFLNSIRNAFRFILGSIVLLGIQPLLDRFTAAAFFPFFFKEYTRYSVAGMLVLNIIYAITFDSLTVTVITVILLGIIIIRNYLVFKFIVISAFIFIIGLTIFLAPFLEKYKSGPYSLFGNVGAVTQSHFLLKLDGNSTWRLVFWYRVVKENFPQSIAGIGMGTPLLPYKKHVDTAVSNLVLQGNEFSDEHDIHVMGAHNTYLTLSTRLGIVYLVILISIYAIIFREYYQHFAYYRSQGNLIIFFSFFTISIIGLFNLVLESPISAATYWVLLGLVSKVIYLRVYS